MTFPSFKSTVTSIPAIKYAILTEIAYPRFLRLSPISGGWFNSHFSIGFASLLVKTPKASEFLASKTCGTHSRAARFCTRRGAENLEATKTKRHKNEGNGWKFLFISWNRVTKKVTWNDMVFWKNIFSHETTSTRGSEMLETVDVRWKSCVFLWGMKVERNIQWR